MNHPRLTSLSHGGGCGCKIAPGVLSEILKQTQISKADAGTVFTADEAVEVANRIGYPVLVRPSYVLGGQGMEIAYNDTDIRAYMAIINRYTQEHPILVDKYLMGRELEIDAVCDGEDILIPGIMEHIERAGIHSGDSISVYPPINIEPKHQEIIAAAARAQTPLRRSEARTQYPISPLWRGAWMRFTPVPPSNREVRAQNTPQTNPTIPSSGASRFSRALAK